MRKILSFDDVVLIPRQSEVLSRTEPNTFVHFGNNCVLKVPFIAAPMDTVTELDMANAMNELGGMAVVHRFMSIEDQVAIAKKAPTSYYAIGASGDWRQRYEALADVGVRRFCIDIANGHSILAIDATKELKQFGFEVMAGNVATGEGAVALAKAGASSVRAGIASGGMCSTAMVTGFAMPTLQAVMNCRAALNEYYSWSGTKCDIIADGGIRRSSDVVKALAAGANVVMIGSLLAGTNEAPGEVYGGPGGLPCKKLRGMASREVQEGLNKGFIIPEGESTLVPCKGPVKNVIDGLVGGLRSGMSYGNCRNLTDLWGCEFGEVTSHGHREGTPHGKIT